MIFQQIRNATVKVTFSEKVFLVDPWLEDKGENEIIESPDPKKNSLSNPMIDLPIPIDEILEGLDACIVTHIHLDHFATKHLPKDMLFILQNKADEKKIMKWDLIIRCSLKEVL
jgi:L-ascorbate metabolism protein UlaG (beta-lactamase superfamily)